MTPEQKSRQLIDHLLVQSGWTVQDYADMNIFAALGVAVREFPPQDRPCRLPALR
jgi:type I restriction enzyme, R subunit